MRFLLVALFVALVGSGTSVLAYSPEEFAADDAEIDALRAAGNPAAAADFADRAYRRASAELGPLSIPSIHLVTRKANMLKLMGDMIGAVETLQPVHAAALATLGRYNPQTANLALSLGIALADAGRPFDGLPMAVEALQMTEAIAPADDPTVAYLRFTVAQIFAQAGYLEEALVEMRRSAAVLMSSDTPDLDNWRSLVLAGMGEVHYVLKTGEAEAVFQDALTITEVLRGRDHPATIRILQNLVQAQRQAGHWEAMARTLDEAEPRIIRTFGAESAQRAQLLRSRALYLTRDRAGSPDFPAGLAAIEEAIAIQRALLGPTAKPLGESLIEYAAMQGDAGNAGAALQAALEAKAAGVPSRSLLFDVHLDAAQAGVITGRAAVEGVLDLVQASYGSAAADASYRAAIRAALADTPAGAQIRRATDLAVQRAQLEADLVARVGLPADERDTAAEQAIQMRIAESLTEGRSLQEALAADNPDYVALTENVALTLEDVQALLGPEDALVVVDIGRDLGEPSFVLAITQDARGFAPVSDDVDPEFIAYVVGKLRESISLKLGVRAAVALDAPDETPVDFDVQAAAFLYGETLAQVEDIFADKPNLLIEVRGAFAAVPPHLLLRRVPEQGVAFDKMDWLVRHHAITVIPSIFSLKAAALKAARPPAPELLLGFADPDYSGTADAFEVAGLAAEGTAVLRGALVPLPETADELADVALALGAGSGSQRLGTAASEAAVKAAPLADFRMLYFATHGLVSGDVLGGAALDEPALALTPGQGEDGLLRASEIAALSLDADLVVLSACNTATGDKPGGQALSGLAQAFLYAGARGLLVSHWPVESRSAVALMTDVFRMRAEAPGMTAAQAQQSAMLAMIDRPADPRWSHPAYWAPFILVGAPD